MEENKNYISRVKLPNNENIYLLKDLEIRDLLDRLFVGENFSSLLLNELVIDCGTADEYTSE